jgi:hypothetical protein
MGTLASDANDGLGTAMAGFDTNQNDDNVTFGPAIIEVRIMYIMVN